MAKKRTAKNRPARTPAPSSLADLKGDPANPREIADSAAQGLGKSLAEFGDISGIVFNRRTGELVTGHQRVSRIRKRWGDLPIAMTGDDRGVIASPEGHVFAVRFVDWSKARQRAANVAANSQRIAGDFTEDLDVCLSEIAEDLAAESAGLYDDLLFADLSAETVGQQTETTIGSLDLGQHEEGNGDMITLKFAFADEDQHAFVTHAVEHIKSAEPFTGVAVDGQAIAEICKRYLRGQETR